MQVACFILKGVYGLEDILHVLLYVKHTRVPYYTLILFAGRDVYFLLFKYVRP